MNAHTQGGVLAVKQALPGDEEAQTNCSWLGESNCACDALVCFGDIPFLPPLFPIQCLEVAVGNALQQPCAGTVSNGRLVCEP